MIDGGGGQRCLNRRIYLFKANLSVNEKLVILCTSLGHEKIKQSVLQPIFKLLSMTNITDLSIGKFKIGFCLIYYSNLEKSMRR